MAASLTAEGTTTITNRPDILDVPLMARVLRGWGLGANVELDARWWITPPDEPKHEADFAAVRQFRRRCVLARWSAAASAPVSPARR